MRTSVAGRARVGPYFDPPTVPVVTEQDLHTVGLPSAPLATLTMNLLRTSSKGKWHVAEEPGVRCPSVNRAFGYRTAALPVQAVPVLGDYDLCAHCAHQVGPTGPAGVYHRAAALCVAADTWVSELERTAARMDWLAVSRWSSCTPFGPCDAMPALLGALTRRRGWAPARLAAQNTWTRLRDRTDTALATARQAAGPPGLRVLAAAARDAVGRDPDTRREAQTLEAIAGDGLQWSYQPHIAAQALDAWLAAVAADGDIHAGHTRMLAALEDRLASSPVRDVSLLPHPAITPPGAHPSPAAWAAEEYRALRHRTAAGWCDRLDTALRHAQHTAERDTEQLLLVGGWPITSEQDRELAYLTQYDILDRAVLTMRDGHPLTQPAQVPWAVVLRVPAFVAAHAAAHRSNALITRLGPATKAGSTAAAAAVRELLRPVAGFLPADTIDDPDAPLAEVTRWRQEFRARRDLRDLPVLGPDDVYLDFVARWRWTPATDGSSHPERDVGGDVDALRAVCAALYRSYPVVLRVASGLVDALSAVDLAVYPKSITVHPATLTYRAHDLPDCPDVVVPLNRIIGLHEAR